MTTKPTGMRAILPRVWDYLATAIPVALLTVLTAVLGVTVFVYYATFAEHVHHELIEQRMPNGAMWWSIGWGAAGAFALVAVWGWASRRWGR